MEGQFLSSWRQDTKGKFTYQLQRVPNARLSKVLLSLSRHRLRLVIMVLTGHCRLNLHLHRIGKSESQICPKCHLESESVKRHVEVCPAYAGQRQIHLDGMTTCLEDVVESGMFLQLASFLLESGRLLEP